MLICRVLPAQLLFGNGDGTFRAPVPETLGSYYALATGDMNNDGKSDLIISTFGVVNVLLSNGDGTFQPPLGFKYKHGTITSLLVTDLNGDGKSDLVSVNGTAVFLSYGTGGGHLAPPLYFNVNAKSIESIFAADLNRDGKLDVLAAINGTVASPVPHLAALIVQPDNSLAQFLYTTVSPISQVQSADLNGDGLPDVAARSTDGATLQFLYNTGAGNLGPASEIVVPQTYFTLANLRGDAVTDIVITDGNTLQVLINPGDGVFHPGTQESGGIPREGCVTADLNGDGIADLACLAQYQIALFLGTGKPRVPFTAQPIITLIGNATALVAADFTGDGSPDLAAAITDESLQIFANDGSANFTALSTRSPAGPALTAMVAADFDRDGKADIFTSAGVLLAGLGNGQFAAPVTIVSSPSLPFLTVADVSGDGRPDIIGTGPSSAANPATVLINRGSGAFQVTTLPGVEASGAAAVADINRDGKPDLLFPAGSFGVSVVLGTGGGAFAAGASFRPDLWPPILSCAVADFNGDSLPDLAYGIGKYTVWIATGNGDGTFNVPATGFGVADATTLLVLDAGDLGTRKRPDLIAGSGPATVLITQAP